MHLSRYVKFYPLADHPDRFLLFSTLRNSLVQISRATLERVQSGAELGSEGDTLKRLGFLVDDPDLERRRMRSFIADANARPACYSAVVVLNLDCNLNCGYCYEGEFRRKVFFSEENAKLLVDTLVRERLSRGGSVSLAFYGGEPLLSQEMIRRISVPLQEAAAKHGASYGFNLVTNGTLLTRRVARELIPLGLKGAKFTLDGPAAIHDRERPYVSGKGSFATIVDNLAQICDLLPIQLGGNYRYDNYREFPRLLDHLIAQGVTPDKLAVVLFNPVTPQAGCSEYTSGCASSDEPWLIEATLFLRREILARGFVTTRPKLSACVVELDHNVVIDVEGNLFKCPGFMGTPSLKAGTLAEGLGDFRASHAIGNWQNDTCLDCPYLPLCFGGCRFLSTLRGESLDRVDCRRGFLDATLEEFLLQDLAFRKKG